MKETDNKSSDALLKLSKMADDDENALRTIAESCYATACTNLAKDGYVNFATFVKRNGNVMPVMISDKNGMIVTDKNIIEDSVRQLAPQCTWIAQIIEAWTLRDFSNYNPEMSISQHPEREEAIFVNVQSRMGMYMIAAQFKRDEQGKPLAPIVQTSKFISNDESSTVSGRMMNYYYPHFETRLPAH